jgi:hypothetical protein
LGIPATAGAFGDVAAAQFALLYEPQCRAGEPLRRVNDQ